jgi:hypothetical protein
VRVDFVSISGVINDDERVYRELGLNIRAHARIC